MLKVLASLLVASAVFAAADTAPSQVPAAQPQGDVPQDVKPFTSPDACRNLWLYIGGKYVDGDLVVCRGAPPPDVKIGGWFADGYWPPAEPSFVACPKGTAVELVVVAQPDSEVELFLYEWKEGMSFGSHPRELNHWTYPAGLRTHWICESPEGRYLLTAWVHWPGVGTERSWALEIK